MKNSEKRLKIGIDIDEVIVEFFKEYIPLFNQKFNENISFEDLKSYQLWDISDVSKEDSLNLTKEFQDSEFFENMELVEGAKEAIFNLSNNYNIYFITSRPDNIRDKTTVFLRRLFGNLKFSLHFSGEVWGNLISKSQICVKEGINLMVEDNSDYALDCAEKGIKVFLLEKPWNKRYKEHENIIKVKNWEEILEKLES